MSPVAMIEKEEQCPHGKEWPSQIGYDMQRCDCPPPLPRDKSLPDLREMEKQGVTLRFPGGETWTVNGARVRDLWRWYFDAQMQRHNQAK